MTWRAQSTKDAGNQAVAGSEVGAKAPGTWLHRIHIDVVVVLSLPLLLFFVLPLLALLTRSAPESLLASLRSTQVIQAVDLSFRTSLAATLLSVASGTPVAYLLARRRLPFRRALDTILDLPIVLPPAVAGVALLMTFGRAGLVGQALAGAGVSITFTSLAVILAQTFVGAPFYIKAARLGFASISREMLQAAQLDGASGWQSFRYLMAPLAWAALVSGGVMTWARALGEFGATIIFAGNLPGRTQTMPLAIYVGFQLDMNVALTLSIILVLCSFTVLFVVRWLLHREIEVGG